MARHKIKHERFTRLVAKMLRAAPPSSAALDEWESTNGWLDEGDVPESDSATNLALMPDIARAPLPSPASHAVLSVADRAYTPCIIILTTYSTSSPQQ
jgi:hypothetical protein